MFYVFTLSLQQLFPKVRPHYPDLFRYLAWYNLFSYLLTFPLGKIIIIFVKSIKPLRKVFTSASKTLFIILSTLIPQHFTQ